MCLLQRALFRADQEEASAGAAGSAGGTFQGTPQRVQLACPRARWRPMRAVLPGVKSAGCGKRRAGRTPMVVQQSDVNQSGRRCWPVQALAFSGKAVRACLTRKMSRLLRDSLRRTACCRPPARCLARRRWAWPLLLAMHSQCLLCSPRPFQSRV